MRRYVINKIDNIISLISQWLGNLSLVASSDTSQISAICERIQGSIIDIGSMIEVSEGEGTEAVVKLEECCELLWMISQKTDTSIITTLTGDIYTKIRESRDILDEFQIRQEVVFFPYKASMWDSLESVWKKMSEDPAYDVYVVPIPYGDKKSDGTIGSLHCEHNEYPNYVKVTRWQDYNVKERHPDIIYIHNPYDQFNNVTMVHPDYFASELKNHTDKLIYIPYFVATNDVVGEHFCILPGVLYAHEVIVQSEEVRRQYISYIRAYEKKNRVEGVFGDFDKKIVAGGSPKFDKVRNAKKEDYELPDEWRKMIFRPDGGSRKVIFYNTVIATIIDGNGDILDKIEWVFDFFKNRDDVVLLWRPHPLLRTTIESRLPHLVEKYDNMVNDFKNNHIGIYDDSSDMYRAIIWSDAYYGDASSVVELYKQTRKPIMIQNKYVR